MNKKTVIPMLAGVLVITMIVVVIKRTAKTSPSAEGTNQAVPARTMVAVAPTPQTPRNYRKWSLPEPRAAVATPPAPPQSVELPGAEGQPATQGVTLQAGQVLATVNQIPITVADLVPVPAGEADVTLQRPEARV